MSNQIATVFRRPTIDDATAIWGLVNESGVLDRNSAYLYLLLCRDFSETCIVAEGKSKIVGFVTGYRMSSDPAVLFVWQVGVGASARRQGLALGMLKQLVVNSGDSLRFVEATVSPSNVGSRRLFESLARSLETELVDTDGFSVSDFPAGDHEAEPRIRIGPITQKQP